MPMSVAMCSIWALSSQVLLGQKFESKDSPSIKTCNAVFHFVELVGELVGSIRCVFIWSFWDVLSVVLLEGFPDLVVGRVCPVYFCPFFTKLVVYVCNVRDILTFFVRVREVVCRWSVVATCFRVGRFSIVFLPIPFVKAYNVVAPGS